MSQRHGQFRTKAATSFDVARLAGVSRSAVSRTFTEGASVAPETRRKVLEAAATLRYRPNLAARSLITRRSMIVALAISHLDNQFYPLVVQRLSEQFARFGYRLLLYITHGDARDEPLIDELRHFGVDGLVLASRGFAADLLIECNLAGLPVVMLNNASATVAGARVVGDNRRGGGCVGRFLVAGGHQRFAFLAGDAGVSSSEERLEGYAAALQDAGAGRPQIVSAGFEFEGALTAAEALLSSADRPEALFCANDHMAFAALQVARRQGLIPGEDISIVGFDNVTIGDWPDLALTTYAQPPDEIAAGVVRMLMAQMDGSDGRPEELRIPGRLVVRSTARKPQEGLFALPDGNLGWHDPAA